MNEDARKEAALQSWREFRQDFAQNAEGAKRAMLIISGGATVAFLTFLGTASSVLTSRPIATAFFSQAMQMYLWSVTCCLLMFGFSFFSQASYNRANRLEAEGFERKRADHLGLLMVAFASAFGFLSIGLFVLGSYEATVGFDHFASFQAKVGS